MRVKGEGLCLCFVCCVEPAPTQGPYVVYFFFLILLVIIIIIVLLVRGKVASYKTQG